jgi:hypothetical protein
MTPQQQMDADQAAWAATQPVPSDIGADEIRAYWKSRGVADTALRCFTDPYAPTAPDWVQHNLAPAWKKAINTLDVKASDVLDCDDFADGARWFAGLQACKERAQLRPAFFYICYMDATAGMHARCGCMWRAPDRTLQVAFFEPQPTKILSGFALEALQPVTLTADEIASATDIRY